MAKLGTKSTLLLFKPQRGSHFLSHIARKVAEHKAFRSSISVLGVIVVAAVAYLYQAPRAFSEADFKTTGTVTPDIQVQTKSTSRWPIIGVISNYFSYYHPGIDILQTLSTPIHPFYKGVVIRAEFTNDGYGNMVLIDHQNGYVSRYAHLNVINVKVGDTITQDTVIGTVGLTGHTTGSHLHFEIYENGHASDPLTVLPQVNFAKITPAPVTLVNQPQATTPANSKDVTGGPAVEQKHEKEPMDKLTVHPSTTEISPSGMLR